MRAHCCCKEHTEVICVVHTICCNGVGSSCSHYALQRLVNQILPVGRVVLRSFGALASGEPTLADEEAMQLRQLLFYFDLFGVVCVMQIPRSKRSRLSKKNISRFFTFNAVQS